MFDKTGNDQINYKEFVSGLSPLCHGTVEEIIAFSFKLYDLGNTGRIEQEEMEQALIAINETASYFGDPVLKRTQIKDVVVDIYEHHAGGKRFLDYSSYAKAVADHPVVVQFANGEGTERYSTGMSYR